MPLLKRLIPGLTLILSGLSAGLFFAYSCSVNPGLHALAEREYLMAMQSINQAIQNPVFFTVFMGLVLLLPLTTLQLRHSGIPFRLALAATISYLLLVFGLTIFGNVPLNNALEQFDPATAKGAALVRMRAAFEAPWNRFHTIRTVASITSFALLSAALTRKK